MESGKNASGCVNSSQGSPALHCYWQRTSLVCVEQFRHSPTQDFVFCNFLASSHNKRFVFQTVQCKADWVILHLYRRRIGVNVWNSYNFYIIIRCMMVTLQRPRYLLLYVVAACQQPFIQLDVVFSLDSNLQEIDGNVEIMISHTQVV